MSYTSEQKANFAELIRVLKEVAKPEYFNMDAWQCGTFHCAYGWYCFAHPEKFYFIPVSTMPKNGEYHFEVPRRVGNPWETDFTFEQIQEEFGISEDNAWMLFDSADIHGLRKDWTLEQAISVFETFYKENYVDV